MWRDDLGGVSSIAVAGRSRIDQQLSAALGELPIRPRMRQTDCDVICCIMGKYEPVSQNYNLTWVSEWKI